MIRKRTRRLIPHALGSLILSLAMTGLAQQAIAGHNDDDDSNDGKKSLTIIHISDVHGHIRPHDEDFIFAGNRENSGGVARLGTGIKEIRERVGEENSLTLMVGDATHGGAEVLFTLGNAIMPIFNAYRIDAFVMGNWDWAYGTRVTRNRYVDELKGTIPMSPNNQTTLSSTIPACNGTAGPADCNVIAANYDTVANNVYWFPEAATGAARKPNLDPGNRVLKPWVIKEAAGVKVGYVGITSSRLPVQNPLFNLGFRFTKGYNELPQDIADAKAAGADIIVLATELGLGDNIQIAKEISGIDVILSGDTHESIPEAITIENVFTGKDVIIVESGEDSYLGELTLDIRDGNKIKNFEFNLHEMTDEVPEDTSDYFVAGGLKALVEDITKEFYSGPDFKAHTFGPGGFKFGFGHTLATPLDSVAGYTEVELERRDVIGDFMNNFIGDATLALGKATGDPAITDDTAFAISNGFRFDIPVFGMGTPLDGPDGGFSDGAITVGEIYNFMPFTPAVSLVEFTGGLLRGRYEGFLEGVFDPHAFRHRGGWWMGFSDNMRFVLDLELSPTSVPLQTIGGRILSMELNGQAVDPSKIYTVVSCYPNGEGTDRQCRTSGGRNMRFPCGAFNPDLNTPSVVGVCPPLNTENIVDVTRRPAVLQVAPNDFWVPAQVLREHLKTNVVTFADHGPQRKNTETVPYNGCPDNPPALDKNCDGVPDSDFGEVQPAFGAGPTWLGRLVTEPAK
jgi:2',3'-cyclic-nucleotide 2'-phosphodiesterase (5'-nucleotidase family)